MKLIFFNEILYDVVIIQYSISIVWYKVVVFYGMLYIISDIPMIYLPSNIWNKISAIYQNIKQYCVVSIA